jgi:hypothetical protein
MLSIEHPGEQDPRAADKKAAGLEVHGESSRLKSRHNRGGEALRLEGPLLAVANTQSPSQVEHLEGGDSVLSQLDNQFGEP